MNPVAPSQSGPSVAQSAGTLAPRPAPAPQSSTDARPSVAPAPAPSPEANAHRQVSAVHEYAEISRNAVESAVHKIETFVKSMDRSLSFSFDDSTNRAIVRVVDPSTNEVIRELPPEETLEIARTLEYVNAVLVSRRA
jgi:flagellar protein FlaG